MNYRNKLALNINVFWQKFSLEQLISKPLIQELVLNEKKEDDIDKLDFWKWSEKDTNFQEFLKIKELFLDMFIEKVKFCPYCGKIPLIRYENDDNEKKWTYHLDHIFPKSKYRYLTYNFYNLIPVCSICNQLKWRKELSAKKNKHIFHPYYWLLQEKNWKKYFDISKETIDDNFLNFFKENTRFYNLDKIYFHAQDTHNDTEFILDKISKINTDKDKLTFFDIEERKEHYFKNFYPKDEKDTLKYSNWKLRRKLINDVI